MKAFKILLSLTLSSCLLFTACVDADIDEAVDYDDFYLNVDDADAAILGLYGKFMDLAAPVVVLNELRGDLMDVTSNASYDLQQINRNENDENNKWTNVVRFYNVIQNCNDMLDNFDKMKAANKLTTDEYNERYSDVAAIRTWIYYQLGIHFGKVPYITEPVIDINNLKKYEGNEMSLDELVPELIKTMEALPTLENYRNSKLVTGTVDGYSLVPFFINKKCFMGDLYLLNNEYEKAAAIYREVMRTEEGDEFVNSRLYRVYTWVWTGGEADWFQILYDRFRPEDVSSLYNAWKGMFSLPADNAGVRAEMIWEMSYDYRYAPEYPFIELFSNKGKGKYLLKPSTYAVENLWGGQTQTNGFPFDARGLTGGVEETATGSGQYLVAKYTLNYDAVNKPFEQQGKWFLYRTAALHLRYAEAANRAGYPRLAWALLNDGVRGQAYTWRRADGSEYPYDSIRVSSFGPGVPYPAPYDFDARENTSVGLRGPWRNSGGIRGRANLPNIALGVISKQDSINKIEELIIEEAALELGFEGYRWTDLIRIARRLEKEGRSGSDFLNNVIRGKYTVAGTTAPSFSNQDDWYLTLYK